MNAAAPARPKALGISRELRNGHQSKPHEKDAVKVPKARYKRRALMAELVPESGVAHCGEHVSAHYCEEHKGGGPGVVAKLGGFPRYVGLAMCGLLWLCALCAAKISERRREELQRAVDNWAADGGTTAFITYTFRHLAGDRLCDVLKRFKDAQRHLFNSRAYKDWCEKWGVVHNVRAFEATYNRLRRWWHPHRHEIAFRAPGARAFAPEMEAELQALTLVSLAKFGLSGKLDVACTVKEGDLSVADYIAKFGREPAEEREDRWTVARELAKGVVKSARGKDGYTPLSLIHI